MPLTVVIASLLFAKQSQSNQPFVSPFVVAEPRRMALTPKLDGRLEDEEWDELSVEGQTRSYLQWEPGRIYAAARVAAGHDLVVSFDLKSNGWLVGNDNIEVRVSDRSGRPKMTVRRLDATNPNAPTWKEMPEVEIASKVVSSQFERSTIYEIELDDPATGSFDMQREAKFGVRFDALPQSAPATEAFFPRLMAIVQLAMHRSAGLPGGLTFNPEGMGKVVEPGDDIKLRFAFNGTDKAGIEKVGFRTEGFAKEDTALLVTPFPGFDNRNRAYLDFNTPVRKRTSLGWRIVRGTITTNDGLNAITQMSFRVAPAIDIELVREVIKKQKNSNKWRLNYFVGSNSTSRTEGTITVTPPEGFRLVSAADSYFSIYSAYGRIKKPMDIEWVDAKPGTYPVHFKVVMGTKTMNLVQYVKVE